MPPDPSDPLPECDPGKCTDTAPTISPDLSSSEAGLGDDSAEDSDEEEE